LALASQYVLAGGPRWVQGSGGSFQYPGTPIKWGNGGAVLYYTDLGPLSSSVSNSSANSLVATAFAPWNAVVYSAVNLTSSGNLNEDVSGGNVYIDSSSGSPIVVWPSDAATTYTPKPLAVIYDEDGSIIDLLLGSGASDPLSCNQNGVIEDVDNVSTLGIIQHARLILNGRCTGTSDQLSQMQYQLTRMAGRILGLDWSQANDNVFTYDPTPTVAQEQYWPVMHPIDIICGPYTYQCMVSPFTLRMDDEAALGRLYPVTTANLSQYPGKQTFASDSAGFQGTVSFPNGQGMNGVNVVLREAAVNTNPLFVYPEDKVTSVTGYLYAGNPVTGTTAVDGSTLPEYGSLNASYGGTYDVSGLQPAVSSYSPWDWSVVSFEAVNPLYIGEYSVGPYTLNQVTPPGTFTTQYVPFDEFGGFNTLYTTISSAPGDASMGAGGGWSQPQAVNSTGWWNGRFGAPQDTAWFNFNVQANRTFTVETTALDENGLISDNKAMPVIGLWNAIEAQGTTPDWSTNAFNSAAIGATSLQAQTTSAELMCLALADQRGDGRPDFNYQARVLYADNISPALVDTSGGTVIISGMGFRTGNQVQIDGVTATVLATSDSQIVVTAPALSSLSGVSVGTALDIEVSDASTGGLTIISGGLTYVSSTVTNTGVEQLIAVSGSVQQISQSQTLSPVVLQLLSGSGTPMSGVAIQISQAMYGWQAPCTGPGRCPSPPLLSTSTTSATTDGNGEISVSVLQLAATAESTTIVATAGTAAMIQFTVTKTP